DRTFAAQQIDMSGTDTRCGSQTVGTSEEALDLGDVAAGGLLVLTNHHASATVSLRANTGETNAITWKAGETFPVRLASGSTPYLIASTSSVRVSFILLDD